MPQVIRLNTISMAILLLPWEVGTVLLLESGWVLPNGARSPRRLTLSGFFLGCFFSMAGSLASFKPGLGRRQGFLETRPVMIPAKNLVRGGVFSPQGIAATPQAITRVNPPVDNACVQLSRAHPEDD